MKGLGTKQVRQINFNRLNLSEKFQGVLGNLPKAFMICVHGESGQGKTEFDTHLAIELSRFGHVKWVSYETSISAEMQDAIKRNNIEDEAITWCDPFDKLQHCTIDYPKTGDFQIDELFGDLVMSMDKRGSPMYWIFDSADATDFSKAQIKWLEKRFRGKKGLVWICQGEGKKLLSAASTAAKFYSSIAIWVSKQIAYPLKNRYGGNQPYVIWEEKAKELNPEFFGIVPTLKAKRKRKKRKAVAKKRVNNKEDNQNDEL